MPWVAPEVPGRTGSRSKVPRNFRLGESDTTRSPPKEQPPRNLSGTTDRAEDQTLEREGSPSADGESRFAGEALRHQRQRGRRKKACPR